MRAITYHGLGDLRITDVAEPEVRAAGDVLIKIEMTGICGTDHKIIEGKLDVAAPGTILGHEGVGTVVETGADVTTVQPGDRVIINPTQSCLRCPACKLGRYCYCENFDAHQIGFSLPGTFAEHAVIAERWLYKIPTGMSWEVASLIEPLGCSLNTLVKSRVQRHESVLVIGTGPIGALCLSLARTMAGVAVGIEPSAYRREIAAGIAHHALHPDELTTARIREITGTDGFDVVIDAVGNQLEAAMRLVNKGGRVTLMGYDDKYRANIAPTALIDAGINLVAEVPLHDPIGPAVAIAQNMPDLKNLVTVDVALEDYRSAFEQTMGRRLETGEPFEVTAMKAVIRS